MAKVTIEKGKYIGARYIGTEPLSTGDGWGIEYGMVMTSMTESEAIGRSDFEPVYAELPKGGI